jgi:hypothetical protein
MEEREKEHCMAYHINQVTLSPDLGKTPEAFAAT